MWTTNTTGQSGRRAVERQGKRAWVLIGLAAAALLGLGLLGLLAVTPAFAQQPATADASLSGLELSGYAGEQQPKPVIALRPAFDAATLSYGASAAYTRQVRLRATANQAGATITVDGRTVASGAYSQAFTLRDNQPQRIEVRVTAPDGTTEQVYALTATNNPAAELRDLSLSPVELHPSVFATSQQAYQAFAAYSVDAVRVTATRRHGVETLTVNGVQVTSGQASEPIALELGANLITVVATAPDQYTSKRYSITVTRASEAQSSDATLSGISVYQATSFQPDNGNNVPYEGDPLPLTPAVSSTVREYQAEKAEQSGENDWYVAVAVTTNAPGAKSIVVDGPKVNRERRDPKNKVVSGEASGPWQLAIGYRLITITVTSLDGTNTETYRLVIKYGTLDELPGLRLSSGDGSLTLHWEASESPTAPTDFQLRWRKAGETTWLNRGFPAGWKTSYALDAATAGPADGDRYQSVSAGSATLSGLENGVAYEVHVRGARGSLNPETGERQVFVFLRTDWRSLSGTPGQTRTALAITPSSPSREYGGVDDLSYTVSGLLDGDAAADVLTGGLSRAAGADVGRYAISMGTLAVAGDYAATYELASAPTTAIYAITPRPIPSISGVTVTDRDADGTTTASFDTSAAVGTDVLAAELADFRAGGLRVTGSFPTAAAGRHNLAVTYALRDQGSFKAANYSLTQTTGALQGELIAVEVQPACRPAVGGDYDRDDDGLIEVCSLEQLNAMRFDAPAKGAPGLGLLHEYTNAFPGIVAHGPGCPDDVCRGYELVVDLDFDTNGNGRADAGDQFWNDGQGWDPMPILNGAFAGTFEGNGHTIRNLYINKPMKRWNLGLFSRIGAGGEIRNLRLEDVRVLGGCDRIAGLAGSLAKGGLIKNVHVTGELHPTADVGYQVGLLVGNNLGRIEDSSASGNVTANKDAGILVGKNSGVILRSSASGTISGSSRIGGLVGWQTERSLLRGGTTDATVTGAKPYKENTNGGTHQGLGIGGLVGINVGRIQASMSSSTVRGQADAVGGLVGGNVGRGSVVASYATGDVSSSGKNIGGLVGSNASAVIRASYSTARSSGGGLVGSNNNGGRVQWSYWDTEVSGAATSSGGAGMTTSSLLTPSGYTGIYANWNLDLDGNGQPDDPWVFSTYGGEYPILRNLTSATELAVRAGILLVADAVPAQDTADDLMLTAIGLPGAITITPAFDSATSSYTITLPPQMREVTLYGRFAETGGGGAAYLAVAPDVSSFDAFDAQSVDQYLLAQLSGATEGDYQVALDNGESQTLQVGVFKWKPDEVNQEPFDEHTLKRTYTITLIRAAYPTDDAKLIDLSVSPGSIAFGVDTRFYEMNVASTVNSVYVAPRTKDPEATVTVNGGLPNGHVSLTPGANLIKIVVTARDGVTTGTYQLTVQRAFDTKMRLTAVVDTTVDTTDDMQITGLALPEGFTIQPAFSPDQFEYALSAPLDSDQLELVANFTTWTNGRMPDSAGCQSTAYVLASSSLEQSFENLNQLRKDPRSRSWPLGMIDTLHSNRPFGEFFDLFPGRPTKIVVTLAKWKPCGLSKRPVQDFLTTKTYTFTVTRALPDDDDASLSALNSSIGPINLVEGQTAYAKTVGNSVSSVTVTPVALHPSATVSVNGASPTTPVELSYGATLIQVLITAPDGATTQTYTLTLTRPRPGSPPPAPQLDLEVELGSVTVSWDPAPVNNNAPVDIYEVRVIDNTSAVIERRQLKVEELNGELTTTFSGLTNGRTYTFGVRSRNDGGVSKWIEDAARLPMPNELRDLSIYHHNYLDRGNPVRNFQYQRGVQSYRLTVPATKLRVKVEPSLFHDQATFTINGVPQSRWGVIELDAGANQIRVVVSAPGMQPRTYTVAITRESPPRPTTPLGWSIRTKETSITSFWRDNTGATEEIDRWEVELIAPDGSKRQSGGPFAWDGYVYSHSFANLLGGETYTFRIRGVNAAGAGDWSTSKVTLPLEAGLESISLRAITRAGGSNDYDVQLAQSFIPRRTVYTIDLPHQVIGLLLAPSVTHPKTVTINGKNGKIHSNRLVTLQRGKTNEISIVVTDGSKTRTYTISATRDGDGDAPTVASPIGDQSGLSPGDSRQISLDDVFTDPNGDELTITARSSDESVATVAVAEDYTGLTLTAKTAGSATITVTADDSYGGTVNDTFAVDVNAAPTVASALSDVSGLNVGAPPRTVSLAGVFQDADTPSLTITAQSDSTDIATVSVASDFTSLTLTAKAIGTATITVTADDGDGNTVSDSFTVTVTGVAKLSVASPISDLSAVETCDTRSISLSGVFAHADGDALTITALSSNPAIVTVGVAPDYGSLTITPVDRGGAVITVTAADGNGETLSDTFTVAAVSPHAALIRQMWDWRNDPNARGAKSHTDRWDRALLAFGETVTDQSLTAMTAAEAQVFVDLGWPRWIPVTAALVKIEASCQVQQVQQAQQATNAAPTLASALSDLGSLRRGDIRQVPLSGVFQDADGDSLTITAQSSAAAVATVSVATDGASLTVTAVAKGTATITVTADDGKGGTVSDSFTVTVVANAAPTVASAISDISGLKPGATRQVSLAGVFQDAESDALTISARSSAVAVATVSVAANGASLTVTGVAQGTASITVTANDGRGGTVSDSFTVTVAAANTPPTLVSPLGDLSGLKPGATRTVSLAGVFRDPNGDALTISAKSSATAVATVSVASGGGSLTVTGVSGGTATITVSADDGDGATALDSFTVEVDLANAKATLASPLGNLSGLKPGATRTVSLTGVFQDADGDALTITAKSSAAAVATVSVASGGASLTVTAVAKGTATITVSADDGNGGSVSDSFTVTVAAANAAPTVASAIGDLSGIKPGTTRQVSLTGVFSDADSDALTITAKSSAPAVATVGVVSGGGSLSVTAVAKGTATITVSADDGNGGSVEDSFTVTVAAANAAPRVASAMGDLSGLRQGDTRQVLLSNVFSDADGDALTFSARSSNSAVASVASANASLTVTAVAEGAATITVTASDGKGGTVSDSFTVTVIGNAAPRAVRSMDDVNGLTAGTTQRVLVNDRFRDADNDPLTITAASSNDAVARVSVDSRNWSMTVSAVSAGTATITVTADDGQGGRASASFRVTVNAAPESEPEEQDSGLEGEPEQELVVQDVITRYDTNGDGEISLDEYNAAIPDLGTTLTVADLMKLRAAYLASAR